MTAEYVVRDRKVLIKHRIALSLTEPVILAIHYGLDGQKMAARDIVLKFERSNGGAWAWRAAVQGPRIRKDGSEGATTGTNSYGDYYLPDPPEWLQSIVESEHPDSVTR